MADLIRALPKIELHCHLDACVRPATVAEIGRATGIAVPEPVEEALIAPAECDDLRDYLRRIDLAVDVMQRACDLTRISRELVEDLAHDGVVYAEIRFAPQLHTRRGLSLQEVLEAVNAGFAEGMRQHPVRVGTIVCCLRHEPPAVSLKVAELAVANRGGVVALDLAGDEARHPGAPHAAAFHLARRAGLRRTVHAGEAAGGDSVVEAIDVLGAERIGHGVRVEARPGLADGLRTAAIPLEMCPISNVQTRAVGVFKDHPLPRLLARGLKVTVNTDGRVTSDTSLTREFTRLGEELGLGLAEFFQLQGNAVDAAFAPADLKEELRGRLQAARAESELR
jgi:adenosine deaminase